MSRKVFWWKNQKVKLEQIDIIGKFVAKQFSHKPLVNYIQVSNLLTSIEQKENHKLAASSINNTNRNSPKNQLKEGSVHSKTMREDDSINPPTAHTVKGKRSREHQEDENVSTASDVSPTKKKIKILPVNSPDGFKDVEKFDDSDRTTATASDPPASTTTVLSSKPDSMLIDSISQLLDTFGRILKILIEHVKHAANRILLYYFDVLKVKEGSKSFASFLICSFFFG